MKHKESAFTLLELLVAMTIMSIIGASLYTSLHLAFRARDTAEAAVEKARALEIAMSLIKEDLISAMPPTGVLAGAFEGEDEQDADGNDADTLSFYSSDHVPDEDEIACDVRKVEIGMTEREGTDERVVVRGITTNLLSPKTLDPGEEILCGGVASLNFRYYDGSDWQDDWDSGDNDNTLPEAIEMTVSLENDEDEAEDDDDTAGYALTQTVILPCGGGGASE
jgi:type II secretion system protein J